MSEIIEDSVEVQEKSSTKSCLQIWHCNKNQWKQANA